MWFLINSVSQRDGEDCKGLVWLRLEGEGNGRERGRAGGWEGGRKVGREEERIEEFMV